MTTEIEIETFTYCNCGSDIEADEVTMDIDGDPVCSECAFNCECCNCGSDIEADKVTMDIDGDPVCSECAFNCERCNYVYSNPDEAKCVDGGEYWCHSCVSNYANYCDGHDEWHSEDSYTAQDRAGSFCERCIQGAYFCEECDEYNFDGCERCADRGDNERVIHDYNYRPDPIFHATQDNERLYFGMEIEVEAPKRNWESRQNASEYAQQKLEMADLAYLKSDGSLNCGFEIVTHPMTHDFFKNEQPEFWDTLEHLRTDMNMRSWSTETCGLHIHISRTGFNGGSHMHRFLSLVYGNESAYSTLAGRNGSRWAKFDDVMHERRMIYDTDAQIWRNSPKPAFRTYKAKIKDGRNTDRYSAVNTQNANTLEMRIFRGSLKESTVKACLDLAHASVEYTRTLTVKQVRDGALQWGAFHDYISARPELYAELNARITQLMTQPTTDSE